tara:strand:- start:2239 stop:2448 length:210 start_codon:yes stop_codon:yes gene_type:complete
MMPFIVDIDPYIIDILIEREKSMQKEIYHRSYLELPLDFPDIPPEPPSNESNEKKDNNNNDDGIIIIDM